MHSVDALPLCFPNTCTHAPLPAPQVLGPGAAYLQITYAPPRTRLRYLQRPGLDWAVSFWEVGQQGRREGPLAVADLSAEELGAFPKQAYSHFVYVCVKPAAV